MNAQAMLAVAALGDADLARHCAARDGHALRHVITTNNQRLFRAAWSILKDRGEAEEAVQSAYLKAFDRIDEFEGRSTLSTWLTRIAINEALQRRRSNNRRRRQWEAEGVSVLETYRDMLMRGSDPALPDADLARVQLRRMIEGAVAALPDEFRTVFVLRDIEGLSVEETSVALGLLPATVKTRLLRARRKLRDALAPDVQSTLAGSFPFAGADCESMTERVMAQLSSMPKR